MPHRAGLVVTVGQRAEELVAWLCGTPEPLATAPPGPHDVARRRWRGGAVLAGLGVAVASPAAAVLLVVAVWWAPSRLARRREEQTAARLARDLPLAVELLAVAAHAGLTVAAGLAAVAGNVGGELGSALEHAAGAAGRGQRLADALAELGDDLGAPVRPLTAVLTAAVRDGDPLAPALDRLADSLRRDRQRRAEVAARRLSVQLLLPLVACILPAFALLTVVPLLLGSLRALPR